MPRIYYGTLGEGYVRRTPLGDPRVCHVYYGAIGTLGEGRTPLDNPGDRPIGIIMVVAIGYPWEL